MKLEQRAQQFWPVLVFAAREQKLISYAMLSQMTGSPDVSDTEIALHSIFCYCKQHNLPALNVIVIDEVTGQPGTECRVDFRDVAAQQSSVFLYDWLNHPAPSDDMFQEALANDMEMEMANAGYVALSC